MYSITKKFLSGYLKGSVYTFEFSSIGGNYQIGKIFTDCNGNKIEIIKIEKLK